MTPSLEGWATKSKEALSPHEARLAPLDNNPVFQNLGAQLYYKEHFQLFFQTFLPWVEQLHAGTPLYITPI